MRASEITELVKGKVNLLSFFIFRRSFLIKIIVKVFFLAALGVTAVDAGEYCYETKCWQYKEISDVRVGGMKLANGKYVRADQTKRSANGEKTTSHRLATMVFAGDIVDVDIYAFDEGENRNESAFTFRYDLANEKLVDEKTDVKEQDETRKLHIRNSIPEIADDLFKNHGQFSSGDSIEFNKTAKIRGDSMDTNYVLTVLGKVRYQGEDMVLLRSEYTFSLAPVTGKAVGYLMQDAIASMPRHSAHLVTINAGDEVITMKSKGYVSILAR